MQVIVATGNHLAVPRPFGELSPDVIAELVRAGDRGRVSRGRASRPASSRWPATRAGLRRPQEVVLRAAARTHKATGVPISTHTWSPERIGEAQVRILEEEGVDLDKVYIGHSNDDTDLDYLFGLLNKGVWLGLDRYPGGTRAGTPNWEQRTEVAKALMDAGFTHRIFLSHDYSVPKARHGAEVQEQRQTCQSGRVQLHSEARAATAEGDGGVGRGHSPDHGGECAEVFRGGVGGLVQ